MKIERGWQEYQSSLSRFLASKVANPTDVEDLLQNILIKTHQNMGSLNSKERLKPWLFQIANRTIIDFYRQQSVKRELTAEDLWYEDEEANENALAQCVEPFIRNLPAKYAELLRAIELEGQSQKDYAEKLGISYSTLKSRVQKSRQQLRRLFDECCSMEVDAQGNAVSCDPKKNACDAC